MTEPIPPDWPTQEELDKLPVNSIGTCRFCGYYGPGPRHTCKGARPEPPPDQPK